MTTAPKQLYLHIGAMKTGTSYLQGVLSSNAATLREAGVLVSPNRSAPVHDIVNFRARGKAHLRSVRGAWAEFVETASTFEGRATVLSHEFLSLQGPVTVDRILAGLEDLDVHAVLTVRDSTSVLPAQWQTAARNRGALTWPEYAVAAGDPRTKPRSHTFLHSQRLHKMIRIWRNRIGIDHVHVVTVPPPSAPRPLLWERFASVLGVDPGAAPVLEVPSNPSAGYATAHLLCLLHQEAARRDLPRSQAQRLAVFVAHRAAERRAEEPVPPLDETTRELAAAWNREMIRVIERSKVEVTGDLRDLPRKPDLSAAEPLTPPADRLVVDAAHGAWSTLALLGPSGARSPSWRTVEECVRGLVTQMADVIETDGTSRLNARGTALLGER